MAIAFGLVCLPFWLLVRGCLLLDVELGWPPWLALLGGVSLSSGVLFVYSGWLSARVAKRLRARSRGRRETRSPQATAARRVA